jgi:hypothetical protein
LEREERTDGDGRRWWVVVMMVVVMIGGCGGYGGGGDETRLSVEAVDWLDPKFCASIIRGYGNYDAKLWVEPCRPATTRRQQHNYLSLKTGPLQTVTSDA